MSVQGIPSSVRDALAAFDAAFAGGDAGALNALLDQDVQLMFNNNDTIFGRDAVTSAFKELFEWADTSAFDNTYHTVEATDTGAFAMSDFTESLMPRDGSAGVYVSGRGVLFFRSAGDGWLITRLLSARSAPDGVIEST
jgi:ketosteroid isomerase-like protein